MKRYEVVEDPNGTYIKYSDHLKALRKAALQSRGISFKTTHCIRCGKPLVGSAENPSAYGGHVRLGEIPVLAGSCYPECSGKLDKRRAPQGYFGLWKPKYGIIVSV